MLQVKSGRRLNLFLPIGQIGDSHFQLPRLNMHSDVLNKLFFGA